MVGMLGMNEILRPIPSTKQTIWKKNVCALLRDTKRPIIDSDRRDSLQNILFQRNYRCLTVCVSGWGDEFLTSQKVDDRDLS